jgi:hypothetical protein
MIKNKRGPSVVAQAWNFSYLKSRDLEIMAWSQPGKKFVRSPSQPMIEHPSFQVCREARIGGSQSRTARA